MSHSRRDFLKQLSTAAAFGVLCQMPGRDLWAVTPGELIPEPDEALLRRLAVTAVEAARAAGAGFADVRVSSKRGFNVGCSFRRPQRPRMSEYGPGMHRWTDYGIRALVDGAWGFARGATLTPEGVAEVARRAVARARANRPRRPRRIELAPVPRVENGRWAPPIEQDPFSVPVREQVELILAGLAAAEGVRGVVSAQAGMSWSDSLHVFASSEASLIVQRIPWARPLAGASGRSREGHRIQSESVESLRFGWYGYETVSRIDLVTELRQAAERAVASSGPPGPPPVSVEVGRYDLVLGGSAVVGLLLETLTPALNLERALGYRANHEGTSFAAPPLDILGKFQVASPLVTLRADRTRPHAPATVGWDDEGVPADEWTLIQDGVIVDYLTSRQTAVELSPWYQARGDVVRSRGCMVAPDKGRQQGRPEVNIPTITLAPAQEDISVDDLIADTKRGLYIPHSSGTSDQQLLSGQFSTRDGEVREIRDGKLGRPMKDVAFQFLTLQLWKSLDALGGSRTEVYLGNYHAVAARVRQVNVLNTGKTL